VIGTSCGSGSRILLAHVVEPVLAQAEVAFSSALAQINIEDLVGAAEMMRRSAA
jgi:hypothetical protein